ncbi:MAG: OstA family protein [Oculatellaceae cyanobacterium Prado106]|jgi:lipopolysaccharide export system protein LptA|nr:OstA family protein [Oculatellaceae cyanobacterium Prado106]
MLPLRSQSIGSKPAFSRRLRRSRFSALLMSGTLLTALLTGFSASAQAPTTTPAPTDSQRLRLDADVTEANAVTGVITARGNVQINYPARQIQATAVQAQYYSREGRIVLSGNVYVLQAGNSLRGETVTYLVNEGRFVALPASGQQVESIYIIQDPNPPAGTTTPTGQAVFNPKPAFKTPFSPGEASAPANPAEPPTTSTP